MSSILKSLVLVGLFTVLALPAFAGRTGGCPYRNQAAIQSMPRDHWAYEAVFELARGSRLLGSWDEQRSLEAFSKRRMCRFHFAKLTARILKHRTWRRRGASLTPARMERLAALISEFRWDFAMMGGRPERLDHMFAQVLREETPELVAAAPVRMITLTKRPKRARRVAPLAPAFVLLCTIMAAAAALERMERRAILSASLTAGRFAL